MPWDNDDAYWQKVTGIPPHTNILSEVKDLNEMCKNIKFEILDETGKQMDDHTFNGVLSKMHMKKLIDHDFNNSEALTGLQKQVNLLQERIEGGTIVGQEQEDEGTFDLVCCNENRIHLYPHDDGNACKIPKDWTFLTCFLATAYMVWHIGDENNKIAPMKKMMRVDIQYIKCGGNLLMNIDF